MAPENSGENSGATHGFCDTCGETLKLLPNGTIPVHSMRPTRAVCRGSKKPPEAVVARV